jgi:hypothetical protein
VQEIENKTERETENKTKGKVERRRGIENKTKKR